MSRIWSHRALGRITTVVGAILACTVLFWRLDSEPVWIDEAFSVAASHLTWPQLMDMAHHKDAVFVPYYTVLHLVGFSVFAGRVLSVLCALGSLGAVYAIGVRYFDRRAGLAAALLLATNYLFFHEAREIRMYSAVTLFEILSWLAFLELQNKPSSRVAAFYGLATIAATYSHPIAFLNVFAQLTALGMMRTSRRSIVAVVVPLLIAVVAYVPMIALARHAGFHQIDWVQRPTLRNFYGVFVDGSGGRAPAIVGIIAIALALWNAAKKPSHVNVALANWLVIPPAAALGVSLWIHTVWLPRYMLDVVPASAILIASFLTTSDRRMLTAPLAVALSVSAVFVTISNLTEPLHEWSKIASVLRDEARPHDALAVYPASMIASYAVSRSHDLAGVPPLDLEFPNASTPFWREDESALMAANGPPALWLVSDKLDAPVAEGQLHPYYRTDRTVDAHFFVLEHLVRFARQTAKETISPSSR